MSDEAKALFDMFPDTPRQTLSLIWQSCGGDFSAAVDEALTLASLDNASGHAHVGADGFAESEGPRERWEDASSFAPVLNRPALTPDPSARTPSSSSGYDTAVETRTSSTAGFTPTSAGAALTPLVRDNGLPKLPWEGKEARYVIGSGELGLLNELQIPRRGAAVPLAGDFLRLPTHSVTSSVDSGMFEPPPAMDPLVALDDGDRLSDPLVALDDNNDGGGGGGVGRLSEPGSLFSPMLPLTHGSAVRKRDNQTDSAGSTSDGRQSRSTLRRPPPARTTAGLPLDLEEHPSVGDAGGGNVEVQGRGGGEDNDWVVGSTEEKMRKPRSRGQVKLLPRGMSGEPAAVCSAGARPPPVRSGSVWVGDLASPTQIVETASSAERIAAFRPGTRFRVAVDKGLTGLGITIKEVRGRFFVYKLQTLADGSPGAAEEAGVKAGDQLLGVEELDFEMERWDMDQLVSYMGELMGVVIIHIMRGFGPLPEAPKSDLESGMSYGVARADNGSTAAEGEADGGNKSGLQMVQRRARRLVEVLEEEELSKPSEAADISQIYCQISDRARQWDTGELWLSVTDMARRPSRKTLAALANQWQPDPPAGWDESDSSDGESSPRPTSATSPTGKGSGGGGGGGGRNGSPDPAINLGGLGTADGDDPGADLDKIGTALLGQPLFTDPGRVGAAAATSFTASSREESGHYWSPWPQLGALEGKAAQRGTVVPTRGLRKALNVRVLEHSPPPALAVAEGSTKSNPRSSAASQTASYLVWVMDVESGAEWRVSRCHPEFAELWDVCTGIRPSLARLDFPPWLPDVKETPGVVEARRPRLEAYLQRLCSLLYMGPLHPSSAHLAHLLQDFLGASARVETLGRLQRSRPERELRQALQVRAWQVLRLPPLERAVANFVQEVCNAPASSRSKKAMPAEAILKRLTEVIEHLQYVVTEGCFNELREMVRSSAASTAVASSAGSRGDGSEGGVGGEEGEGNAYSELERLAEEDEALELISGSVRRQVEAEVFVPVMARIYMKLRTEGATARLEKAVALGVEEARGKPQSFHGIPIDNISPSSWNSSVKLLQTVGLFTLPCDKLDALMAVAHDIPALHRMEHPGDGASSLGADDFLPIFIYVLVNSRVDDLAAQSAVLETLCDPKKMMGEAGFCVATLSAALQHLGRLAEDRIPRGTFSSFLGRRNQFF